MISYQIYVFINFLFLSNYPLEQYFTQGGAGVVLIRAIKSINLSVLVFKNYLLYPYFAQASLGLLSLEMSNVLIAMLWFHFLKSIFA
jgi:hypothetical protein